MGDEDITVRIGTFTVKKASTTSAQLATGLADSLKANVGIEQLCNITVASNVITIAEVEQPWELGKFPVAVMRLKLLLVLSLRMM